jgi:hypothetical protein
MDMKLPNHFPLEDFNYRYFLDEQITEEIAVRETVFGGGDSLIETVRDKTVRTRTYEIEIKRAKNIEANMNKSPVVIALRGLGMHYDLSYLLMQLLFTVHSNPKEPLFHNICMTDIDKQIISTYNRVANSDICKWFAHSRSQVPYIIKDHCRHLLMSMIEIGLGIIQLKYWIPKNIIVMIMEDIDEFEHHHWLTVIYFCDRRGEMISERRRRDQSNFGVKDFDDCFAEHEDQINELMGRIETRKVDILSTLEMTSITDKMIDEYLDYSRPICIGSVSE